MYKNKYPIFLASLGRYERKFAPGIVLLENAGVEFYLVISEDEIEKYYNLVRSFREDWPKDHILVSPKGIGRVRQFTLEAARSFGADKYWMFDDDIFSIKKNKVKIPPQELFEYYEQRMDSDPLLGQISPQYTNVLWRVTGDEIVNNQCPGLVVIHRANVPWNWDKRLRNSEETDWTYKFILNGYNVVIDNTHSIDTQQIGRFANKVGGLAYNKEGMLSTAKIFEEKYGPSVLTVSQLDSDDIHFVRRWKNLLKLRDSKDLELDRINAEYT